MDSLRVARRVAATVLALVLAAAIAPGCSGTGLDASVGDQIAAASSGVAILGESATEVIPQQRLEATVERARGLGIDLRVVVSGDGQPLLNAADVTKEFGGTALTYKAGGEAFEAHSAELSADQVRRAIDAAEKSDLGESVNAFVDAVETEGAEYQQGGWLRIALWVALGLAVIFMIVQLLGYLRARRHAERRRSEFHSRRASLEERSGLLDSDAQRIGRSVGRLGPEDRRRLDETVSQVAQLRRAVGEATTIADLDASEIRIARTAMKLRSLAAAAS